VKRLRPAAADALVFSLLGTAGAVEARLEAAMRPLGLSLAKAGVLTLLAEAKEPLPLSELAGPTARRCGPSPTNNGRS
jgi:hypothetical protein